MKRLLLILTIGLFTVISNAADTPEDGFWKSVKKGAAIEEYRAYLESFPKGKYVGQARAAIEAMEAARTPPDPAEATFWADVKASKQKAFYVAYLEQFPRGRHVADAKSAIAQLEADERQAQARVSEQRRVAEAKAAADAKLAAEQADQEKTRTELADWERAKAINTWLGYAEFIGKRPEGRFVTLAKLTQSKLPLQPGMTFKDCPECPEMVVIPAGSFEMGSNSGSSDEKPAHSIKIGKAFALAKTEVTQAQWKAIMGSNPSHFASCGDNCPVEKVNWNDAQDYVRKLSQRTGKTYRLPSETEWEYACRAGGTHIYCGSNDVDSVAWYYKNSGSKSHGVASKQANAWGLADLSGNVWEWTEDCYHTDYSVAPSDGSAWTTGCFQDRRVLRGGSWTGISQFTRATYRNADRSESRDSSSGFRPARMLP